MTTFVKNPNMFKILSNKQKQTETLERDFLKNLQKTHNKFWTHIGKYKISGSQARMFDVLVLHLS